MAWERKISRTVRVRNDQKLGLLAQLLTTVSDMGRTVGDIVLLTETSRSVIRDITIYGEDVQHVEKLVNAITANPGTKVLEVRDQVLELHLKGKIAIRSRYPLDSMTTLRRVYTPGVAEVCFFSLLVIVAAVVVHVLYLMPLKEPVWLHQPWLPAVAALVLLVPIRRHIRRQLVKMTITGDKLRTEAGLLVKTTRSIQLSKVQDVRVDQSLGQRLLGVGDITIETSGESSRLEIDNIDRPQSIADEIIAASQALGKAQAGGRP